MPITRIKNNQITNATIDAGTKLVDASITAGKLGPNLNYASNLTITGNLSVDGATTTLDTVNTIIEDPILLLGKDQTGVAAYDLGFVGERGDSNNAVFVWKESADEFQMGTTTGTGDGTTVTLAGFADMQAAGMTMTTLAPSGNVTTALNASSTITAGTNITAVATVQGATVTDGTLSIASGSITSGVAATFSGSIQGGTLTDGTASINSGAITGATSGSFSTTLTATGNITGGNLTTAGITNSGSVVTEAVNGSAPTITATGTDSSITLAPNGTGTVAVSSKRITGLATPTADADAATKAYVDSVAEGLDIKESCVAATTAALAAVTYANGASGVGATLTADANGALAAVDGVTLLATERVLIKDQASALQNGIYIVTTVGDAGAAFVLTRAGDMDGSPASEIPGAFTFIEEGTTQADNGFVCTTNAPVTMGTTAINWSQFSGAGQITAGDGLAKAGDVLSVNVDDVTTAISGDAVIVKTSANLTTPNIGVANGDSFTATGTVQGATLTDGTATITSGAIASVTTITTTGNITTGVGNVIAGNVTGAIGDFSGAVSGATLTSDSGITISANDIDSSGAAITVNQASADLDFVVEGNGDANLFRTDAGSDTVLISTATATTGATLKVDSTDSILIPVGTTAQRPTAATGMIRFNTTLDSFEFYDSNSWTTAGADFTVIATENFAGDNSTVAFTLGSSQTTASCIVSINGVVQLPTTAYAVSTTTLTFTEAPLAGDVIEVREITTTSTITFISNAALTASIEAIDGAATVEIVGDLNPKVTGTQDLGSATKVWTNANIDSAIFYDGDRSNTVTLSAPTTVSSNVAFVLPAADGTAGQAIVTDASGNLSFAAAGATVSQDNSTNTAFNIYFAATTSGALTAVKYDGADMTFNPSTSTFVVTNSSTTASIAKYADLAEMYASDAEIEAGTVVHFAGDGKVAVCDEANHHAVAGIVSTSPGYLMNGDQEGTALAIAGRVPTKVTGAVAAGDLMVSAGNGMAMANNSPAIGTVIGKAIEANEGGDAVIEVLALMM